MRFIRSTRLFSTALIASLFTVPSFVNAQFFGFVGVKGGYSHILFDQVDLRSKPDQASDGITFNAFSLSSIPLGANIGFGYSFTPSFALRLDVEYFYRVVLSKTMSALGGGTRDVIDPNAKMSFDATTIMSNLYFDYYVTPAINLYVNAGVGAGLLDPKISLKESQSNGDWATAEANADQGGFAWQIGVGVGYALTQNLGLDFNVRYLNFGKVAFKIDFPDKAPNASAKSSVYAIEALLGLNYRF